MSSTTKPFEEKMNASVNHLIHELASIRLLGSTFG